MLEESGLTKFTYIYRKIISYFEEYPRDPDLKKSQASIFAVTRNYGKKIGCKFDIDLYENNSCDRKMLKIRDAT